MATPKEAKKTFGADAHQLDTGEVGNQIGKPHPPQPASPHIVASARRSVEDARHDGNLSMSIIQVQDLILEPALHRITRGTREIKLPAEEFSLLYFLMRHPGTKVDIREILQQEELSSKLDAASLHNHMKNLRKKIDLPGEIQLIYRYGSRYQLGGPCLARTVAGTSEELRDELNAMLEYMQTPEARAAMKAAFEATPEQMGRAAVAATRKRD
jgi:DNA-binding winged helix-turn-helix (wHTH) protein